jgi:hypothetical protein
LHLRHAARWKQLVQARLREQESLSLREQVVAACSFYLLASRNVAIRLALSRVTPISGMAVPG